jgi:DNA repair photolyase
MTNNGKIAYRFKNIFVHTEAKDDQITREVTDYFPELPVEIVEEEDEFIRESARLPLTQGKRHLWLTRQKGTFIKYCHGATKTSDTYTCCNYLITNESVGCPIECNYCFLQGYMTNSSITVYTNYEKIQEELRYISERNPKRLLRVGTGELSDSLALDPVVRLTEKLARTAKELPNIFLEFKTKTDHVDHLLEIPHRKLIVSWSVNSEWIVKNVEHKSSPLEQRLRAMKKISDAGFLMGIHFDPVVYYEDWKSGYHDLVQRLSEVVDPKRIVWVSMGSFRTPPTLKENIRMRFPKSPVFIGEQIRGTDNKMRYIKPLRFQLYKHIYTWIKEYFGDVFFYFCMESKDLWRGVVGEVPQNSHELDYMFAKSNFHKFPEYQLPQPVPEVYQQPIIVMSEKQTNVVWKNPLRESV